MVDDPYDFGAIAAANAMSDIYAMGGDVLFAINLVAFPDNLGSDILREILRGGAEKVAEAGAVVVGGHSVNDREPKYGLAVTGIIDPQKVKIKGGAKAWRYLALDQTSRCRRHHHSVKTTDYLRGACCRCSREHEGTQ